jgi:hypothetical protein
MSAAPTAVLAPSSTNLGALQCLESRSWLIQAEAAHAIGEASMLQAALLDAPWSPTWETIDLIELGVTAPLARHFPRLSALLNEHPGIVGARLVRLRPGLSRVMPCGDEDGFVHAELAVQLPSGTPRSCGLRVGGELLSWSTERFVIINSAIQQARWNHTRADLVVLVLDLVADNVRYHELARAFCKTTLASMRDRFPAVVRLCRTKQVLSTLSVMLMPVAWARVQLAWLKS